MQNFPESACNIKKDLYLKTSIWCTWYDCIAFISLQSLEFINIREIQIIHYGEICCFLFPLAVEKVSLKSWYVILGKGVYVCISWVYLLTLKGPLITILSNLELIAHFVEQQWSNPRLWVQIPMVERKELSLQITSMKQRSCCYLSTVLSPGTALHWSQQITEDRMFAMCKVFLQACNRPWGITEGQWPRISKLNTSHIHIIHN